MIRYGILLSLTALSSALAGILDWDDPLAGTGLHVRYTQNAMAIREAQGEDLSFYQRILGNPDVMKTMASGKTLNQDFVSVRLDAWTSQFQQGLPTGRMTVTFDHERAGFVHLFAHEKKPGVGEVVFAFDPSQQGKGLGRSSMDFLVNTWAPAVRNCGIEKIEDWSPSISQKFQAFGGEALRTLYGTARPENMASWKCMERFNFHASRSGPVDPIFSCETWEASQHGGLENWIIQTHFSEGAITRLMTDARYAITDPEGKDRTLSLVGDYGSLRYHFERPVPE